MNMSCTKLSSNFSRYGLYLALIFSVSISIVNMFPVFAVPPHIVENSPPLLLHTDKQSYVKGDTITISGHVKATINKTPVTIQVLNPNLNLVHIAQIEVSRDGNFAFPVHADGPLWIIDGKYTVKAEYIVSRVTSLTTFDFKSQTLPESGIISVRDPTSSQSFQINYTITEGTIKEINVDSRGVALAIAINSTNDGSLTLKIPRQLIDAKKNDGTDEKFLVFIDGNQVKEIDDESDVEYRIISLNFYHGESKIEIIGTQIVPEFRYLVMPIVITLMTFVIIISRIRGRISGGV